MSGRNKSRREKVLQDCILVLLEIENANAKRPEERVEANQFYSIMKERYYDYKEKKSKSKSKSSSSSKSSDTLSFYDFVSLSAIRKEQKSQKCFLFRHSKLAFEIMLTDNSDNQNDTSNDANNNNINNNNNVNNIEHNHNQMNINAIKYDKFAQWAPQLYPLATKYNVKRVFAALSRPDTRSTIRTTKNSSDNVKLMFESIYFDTFLEFVNELKSQFNLEENQCPGVKSSLQNHVQPHERVLDHQKGVTDNTGLPPHYGFVLLTDYNLLFHGSAAIIDRTICCHLGSVKKVNRARIGMRTILRRDTALSIVAEQGTFTWNVLSVKNDARERLYWSINTILAAHQLIQAEDINDKKVRHKIIRDASDDVLRQNALLSMMDNKGSSSGSDSQNGDSSSRNCISFLRFAKDSEKKEYISDIEAEIINIEKAKDSWSTFLKSSIKSGLNSMQARATGAASSSSSSLKNSNKKIAQIDEHMVDFNRDFALMQDIENNTYHNAGEANKFSLKEDFKLEQFIHHFRVLKVEMEPLMVLFRFYQCIIKWKNAGLSFAIFCVLELIAIFDCIIYIPCFLLILNAFYMIMMRRDAEQTILSVAKVLIYCGYDPKEDEDENGDEQDQSLSNANADESEFRVLKRIRAVRRKYEEGKLSLGNVQTNLKNVTINLGKVRAIYFWKPQCYEQSQIVCLLCLLAGVLIVLIPFNYLFGMVVFARFLKFCPLRQQDPREKKEDLIDRFLAEIVPDMPKITEKNETSTNASDASEEMKERAQDATGRSRGSVVSSNDTNGVSQASPRVGVAGSGANGVTRDGTDANSNAASEGKVGETSGNGAKQTSESGGYFSKGFGHRLAGVRNRIRSNIMDG